MDPRRLPRARGAVASTERRRAPARSAAPAVGGAALTVSMAEERLLAERPGAMTPPPNPVVTVLLCAPSAPAPGASTADGRRLGVRPGATPGAWLPSPIQDEHDPDPLVKDDELAVSETDSRRFGHITSGTVPRTVFLRCRKEALPSSPSASASVSRPAAGADAAGSACSCAMAAARNPAELSLRPPLEAAERELDQKLRELTAVREEISALLERDPAIRCPRLTLRRQWAARGQGHRRHVARILRANGRRRIRSGRCLLFYTRRRRVRVRV